MEILPGIHRFRSPLEGLDLDHINIYLLKGPQGSILVDTGWSAPGVWEGLISQFKADGLRAEDISDIVVTHVHTDHYGLAAKFKELSGARVVMHREESNLIDYWFDHSEETGKEALRFLLSHGAADDPDSLRKMARTLFTWLSGRVRPDRLVEDGDIISNGQCGLKVLWTPGHSRGHICLYDEERGILFSGDHVLPRITPNIGAHPQNSRNPLGDFIASLEKVRRLKVSHVLPAHGEPFQDLAGRTGELLRHHEERSKEIIGAMGCSPETAYELAGRVPWLKDLGGRPFSALSKVDQRLALAETISHLEYFVSQGTAYRVEQDGHLAYFAAACCGASHPAMHGVKIDFGNLN
ncbi:MAG: MBL fold metallo-hydrolase [Chloroflexi bacterium]|nr:MBL fold metallo-hydrolase [Chloroflexota bacterium]